MDYLQNQFGNGGEEEKPPLAGSKPDHALTL
jgi:hypothetical protein